MKACPYCAESIQDQAVVCRYCNRELGDRLALPGNSISVAANANTRSDTGGATGSPIPEGIRGWSWGAFLLNFIWAIANKTWVGLLTLIPILGWIMPFVLGFKGREWAWENNKWDSVEHFNRVQNRWSYWAVVITVLPGVFLFSLAFIGPMLIPVLEQVRVSSGAKQQPSPTEHTPPLTATASSSIRSSGTATQSSPVDRGEYENCMTNAQTNQKDCLGSEIESMGTVWEGAIDRVGALRGEEARRLLLVEQEAWLRFEEVACDVFESGRYWRPCKEHLLKGRLIWLGLLERYDPEGNVSATAIAISPAYQTCLDGSSSEGETRECAKDHLEGHELVHALAWNTAFEAAKLLKSGQGGVLFLEEQKRWITFKGATCELYREGLSTSTSTSAVYTSCKAHAIEDRTTFLKAFPELTAPE